MTRTEIKKKLVESFENNKFATVDLDDTYRIYCYLEDSNGFWDTYIHMAIDNNVTRQIDIIEDASNIDQAEFETKIEVMLDEYERDLK